MELFDIAEMLIDDTTPVVEDPILDTPEPETELEEVTEVEEDIENTQEVSSDSVKQVYQQLRELGLPLEEKEDVTKEWLEEEWNNLPDRVMDTLLNNIPNKVGKDLLLWAVNKPNLSEEELVAYVTKFAKTETHDLTTNEGARLYLKNNSTFKAAYDDDEEIEEALDLLEDKGKLVGRASKLDEENKNKKALQMEADAKNAIEEKKNLLQAQKTFQENISKEIEALNWKENRKQAIMKNLSNERIEAVNEGIRKSPKAIVQLANLYDYFDIENGNFDKLYALIEGKKESKENTKKLNTLEKSSGLSSLFSTKPTQTKNAKEWVPSVNIN